MRKIILTALALCSVSLCFFTLGCNGCDKPDGGVSLPSEVENELVELVDLRVEGESLRWNSIVNANAYALYINDVKVKEFSNQDVLSYDYDKTENAYTAKLVVQGDKLTNFSTSVEYSVKNLQAQDPEVFANTVKFAPQTTKIYFRILPNTQWNEVNESNYVNFASCEKGVAVEYEYYVEGTGYDEETRTYYADSLVKKNSITVKEQLPTLQASIDANGISWTEVEGAKNYVVIADGEESTVEATSVALNESAGLHTVYVYAIPQDETTYMPSSKACVKYETAKQSVETFTVTENEVIFDDASLDVLYYKSGDEWTKATTASLEKANLSVKLASYYDSKEAVYYLESKPFTFKTGESLQTTFDKDGYINFEANGKNVMFKLYGADETEPAEYNLTAAPSYYVGNCEQGQSYRFKCKFLDEVEYGEVEDIYYEHGGDALDFYVLPTPKGKILNEKLALEMDDKATSYVYGTEEGVLDDTLTEDFTLVDGVEKYFVRAIGSDENYVLSSPVAELDATKWYLGGEQLEAGFRFDGEKTVQAYTQGTSAITAAYDEEKSAMRVASAKGNNALSILVDVTLNAGDFLTFEYYNVVKDAGVAINGAWGANTRNDAATDFETITVYSASETTTISSLELKIFGSTGEEGVYVRSIKLFRKTDITEEELLAGYSFDSQESITCKTSAGPGCTMTYDETENAMEVVQAGSGAARELKFNASWNLNKGDKIVVTIKISNQWGGASFRVNGTSKTEIKNTEGQYVDFVWTADAAYTDASAGIIAYENGVAYYIQSIKPVRAAS